MTYEQPPAQAPDPRPQAETLRKLPFIVGGVAAIAILGAVTIGPGLLRGEETEEKAEVDPRINQPRGLNGMPSDYSQIEQAPPAAPPPAPAAEPAVQQQQQQQARGYGGGPTGPTKAELLKAARMADLKPVTVASFDEEEVGGSGGSAGSGSRLYSKHSLSDPFPCQVNAGTNIPAMTEQKITSASAGTVSAVATRDIWSADKRCLAIPRGTRFVGRYQTEIAEGQARLGVLWTALTRPPPRNDTIDLEETVAGDPDGTAGVTGEVNAFFWRKLGYVTAATILDLGRTSITAGGSGGLGAAVAGVFAGRAASPLDDWAKKQLDIPAVIEVAPREISIVMAQHQPMTEFRKRR